MKNNHHMASVIPTYFNVMWKFQVVWTTVSTEVLLHKRNEICVCLKFYNFSENFFFALFLVYVITQKDIKKNYRIKYHLHEIFQLFLILSLKSKLFSIPCWSQKKDLRKIRTLFAVLRIIILLEKFWNSSRKSALGLAENIPPVLNSSERVISVYPRVSACVQYTVRKQQTLLIRAFLAFLFFL